MPERLSHQPEVLDLSMAPTIEEYKAWVAAHNALPTQDPPYNHHAGDPSMRPTVVVNKGKPIDSEVK